MVPVYTAALFFALVVASLCQTPQDEDLRNYFSTILCSTTTDPDEG